MRHTTTFLIPTLALFCSLASQSSWAQTEHPTLVSVESAQCSLCHEELLEGRPNVHEPVSEDCTMCHDFSRDEGGTTVTLVESEPGLCVMCHDEMSKAVKGELETPHMPAVDSCVSCHDVHGSANELLLPSSVQELCFSCHDVDDTDASHSIPVRRSQCQSCHNPHGSSAEHMLIGTSRHAPFAEGGCLGCHRKPRGTKVRLRVEGGDLCYACHGNLKEQFQQGHVHTAVKRGDCVGCHDPHMAATSPLLSQPENGLCFECHGEIHELTKLGTEHEAVDSGCSTCHDPHRSDHAAQLVADPHEICVMCHDIEDAELTAAHLGADLGALDCKSCHNPHGSAQEHLLASGSVHPPFVDDCGNCHEGDAHQLAEGGGQSLCFMCHSDIEEAVNEASVPHMAMEMAECVDCHSPHTSGQTTLLRSSGGGVCTECHDDKAAGSGQVSHGASEWIGCQSCHLPHGGEKPNLLREAGNQLCNGCHLSGLVVLKGDGTIELPGGFELAGSQARGLKTIDLDSGRNRNHPIPAHPVTGFMPEKNKGRSKFAEEMLGKEIACITCHDPHVGESAQLFAFGASAEFELCINCHPK